jgi:hypothetical protein
MTYDGVGRQITVTNDNLVTAKVFDALAPET